jgi:hypothetical protein
MTRHIRPTLARAVSAAALALAALALAAAPAALPAQVLTFEGLANEETVDAYYAGGLGSLGSGPGPDLGITFTMNAFALVRSNVPGGAGNFGGEPSPVTAVVFSDFPGAPAFFDVAGGFTGGLGLFYSAPAVPVTVRVFSGLGGTGSLLAELLLPTTPNGSVMGCPNNPGATFCPFAASGVAFAGTARSVDFSGALNDAMFDDVTLGAATPAVIPEPGTVALVATGLLVLPAVARRRRSRGRVPPRD